MIRLRPCSGVAVANVAFPLSSCDAWSMATAKASPSPVAPPIFIEFTPITTPLRSTSGPPLFPGLIAASVWISVTEPVSLRALTIPRVTVFDRTPSAEPIATTSWPGRIPFADPSRRVGWVGSGPYTCSTARSVLVDVFVTRAE